MSTGDISNREEFFGKQLCVCQFTRHTFIMIFIILKNSHSLLFVMVFHRYCISAFIGRADRRTLDRLRATPPERWNLARVHFDDARLEELCFRYRARNARQALTGEELARWQAHRAARLHGGESAALTLRAYFERIDALSKGVDDRGEEVLAALYQYAEGMAAEMA